jgi:probable phosphoglycerate mutase
MSGFSKWPDVVENTSLRIYSQGGSPNMVEIPTTLPTRICLVRHGETEWNAERRIQGQIDIGLNDTGRCQAAAAGRWLKVAGIVALYSSDLKRAWTTALAIGAVLDLAVDPVPELRERRYGIFEGLTFAEAQARHPDGYSAFAARNADYDFENGESLRALHARVTGRLAELAARHRGETIAVVVHGGVLDIINRFVRGNPLELPRDFVIPNAGLNWIVAVDGGWAIESWGETAHLEAGARDELPS